VTLQLFDVLLTSPLPCVLEELFLCHWSPSISQTTPQTPPIRSTPIKSPPIHELSVSIISEDELTPAKKNLEEQMKDYLNLVPEYLLSCEQVAGGLGLEHYLFEAHQQVRMIHY